MRSNSCFLFGSARANWPACTACTPCGLAAMNTSENRETLPAAWSLDKLDSKERKKRSIASLACIIGSSCPRPHGEGGNGRTFSTILGINDKVNRICHLQAVIKEANGRRSQRRDSAR